jgi:hypothetical protein
MFEATQKFYFCGTPLGIDDSPQAEAVVADAVADRDGDEQRPDAEDSDQDVDVGTDDKDDMRESQ